MAVPLRQKSLINFSTLRMVSTAHKLQDSLVHHNFQVILQKKVRPRPIFLKGNSSSRPFLAHNYEFDESSNIVEGVHTLKFQARLGLQCNT